MTRARPVSRYSRVALLLLASFVAGHELMIALSAERLRAEMPTIELDGVGGLWESYHALSSGSLGITTVRLEHALTSQTVTLADRIIGNYRSPAPTVRETQWKMAREALAQALAVNPDDSQLKGALRYCDGHLHRINGEARKSHQQSADAQREFTEAVSAFREATELRPGWPDPFLGLMRTFIYDLEDVDRGADALQQAQRLGYTAGSREAAQLADGYRLRAMALARRARTLSDTAVEQEYLARSADAYRRAIALYSKAAGFAAPRSLKAAQRGLEQVEQRKGAFSGGVRSKQTIARRPAMTTTYMAAADRGTPRTRHWTDRIALAALLVPATSCVAVLAIALAYAGRTNVLAGTSRAAAVAPVNLNTVAAATPLEAAMETVLSDAGRATTDGAAAVPVSRRANDSSRARCRMSAPSRRCSAWPISPGSSRSSPSARPTSSGGKSCSSRASTSWRFTRRCWSGAGAASAPILSSSRSRTCSPQSGLPSSSAAPIHCATA